MHRFTGSGVLDVDACRCIFTVDLDADAETLWIKCWQGVQAPKPRTPKPSKTYQPLLPLQRKEPWCLKSSKIGIWSNAWSHPALNSMQRLPRPLPPPPVSQEFSSKKAVPTEPPSSSWSYNAPILQVNYCKIFCRTTYMKPLGIFNVNPGLINHGLLGVPSK